MTGITKKIIKNPYKILAWIISNISIIQNHLPDDIYLRIKYHGAFGKRLNLKNPETFNEKLQWLKLYDRKYEYIKMVDKYEVKKYVEERIGKEYVIPTLGVWDSFDLIDFEALPEKFVLKCTHDSGGVVICKDKSKFNIKEAQNKIQTSLNTNFYVKGREWPYKDVKPRIIAEEYMEDYQFGELRDYKFFSFDGDVKALFIATERQNKNEETRFDFFDSEFRHLPFTNGHPNAIIQPEKPQNYEKMLDLAEKLSQNIPHVRVDLYDINGRIYFGELTFYHWSGMKPFEPEEWDKIFGDWIKLPSLVKSNGFK